VVVLVVTGSCMDVSFMMAWKCPGTNLTDIFYVN